MGHIIAVVGGKGGVGKSVFAANLAIAYQLNFKQRPKGRKYGRQQGR